MFYLKCVSQLAAPLRSVETHTAERKDRKGGNFTSERWHLLLHTSHYCDSSSAFFFKINPNDCLFMKAYSNKDSFSPAVELKPAIRAEIGCSAAWTVNGTMWRLVWLMPATSDQSVNVWSTFSMLNCPKSKKIKVEMVFSFQSMWCGELRL